MALTALRIAITLLWLGYGLGCKVLRLVPRHEQIVARVLGERVAPVLTRLIGVGEIGIAVWTLSAFAPVLNACVQTAMVLTMNVIELRYARDLLAAPRLMLLVNAALLAGIWTLALRG